MSRTDPRLRGARNDEPGQAMVEFALTVTLFVLLVMGILDLGRGIFVYNGVSEAAREIARVTSVHPGSTLGNSPETAAVVAAQQRFVWNLSNPTFSCVDIDGTAISGQCEPGDWVRVDVSATYTPITPVLTVLVGTKVLSSSSSVQIP
jgi:Flp pilus assembly protein TadG